MAERVQKLLARAGYGSRRDCEQYISDGRVRVNGRLITLGDQADPETDTITVDGKRIEFEPKYYIMLNKPKGVLSSTEDGLEQGRTTIIDLVDIDAHLYPVGRLDKPSTGLILLTNDGELAHKLTHPRYGHEKEYYAVVDGHPPEETLELWRQGVNLRGKRTQPVRLKVVRQDAATTHLRIIMREGRKRQIRRVAAQLGFPVRKLRRERLASLRLEGLSTGEWRHLTDGEVRALKQSVAHNSRSGKKRKKGPGRGSPRRR